MIATAKSSLKDLVHHGDHASQYVSIAYYERLRDTGIDKSTGSVADSCDNALAETVNGLYKAELIHQHARDGLAEVEWATLCWIYWWNTQRLHSELHYCTPQEAEDHHWATNPPTLVPAVLAQNPRRFTCKSCCVCHPEPA